MMEEHNSLAHYGVMGMKWGVRKDRSSERMAKRDAKKVAKANVAYGAGAGTERKILARQVKQRSKTSEAYKKAYEKAYAEQPHEKLAAKAEKRHMKDLKVANRNQSVNRALSIGGTIASMKAGQMAGLTVRALNHQTIKLKNGNTIRIDMTPGQEAAASAIAQYGTMALGSIAANKRYADTKNARRRLNYSY